MSFQKHVCSFCWLVLDCYPRLENLPEGDAKLFKKHLEIHHGWTSEIPP